MRKPSGGVFTWGSWIALACSGIVASGGCGGSGEEQVEVAPVTIEIRLHDGGGAGEAPAQPASVSPLSFRTAGPANVSEFDDVARIQVDISYASTGQPFYVNFELTKLAANVWQGDVPLLPRNAQLRFVADALNASGEVAFSGETLTTLTIDNQAVSIPLAPKQNGDTYQMPRVFRIVYPAEMYAGQEEQIIFTIEGNAGAAIGYKITPKGSSTAAADFSPAAGTVTLTNTVADFMALYTPPTVMADTNLDYQVTITAASAQSSVAITTNFRTQVKPRPPGGVIVTGTEPSVLFNPVILSLTANGSETPGIVELAAAVSDDSGPAGLSYQWSFAPNSGTPAATFASNGQGNPGLFQGYTVAHQGTITLAVTDGNNGTTTLHYQLTPGQFADAIDHDSVNGLKQIVSGDAHTCVLTGQNKVRCWGNAQFGQLGYGNAIDVGDAPTRLPYTAGDVPLPVTDPVSKLVAGNNHTCALLQSGLIYCWGQNQYGQLGYGRIDNLADGEVVTSFGYVTLGGLATKIAAGGDHTCAILESGALRCWGRNENGQLGRGNTAKIGDDETVYSAGNVDLGAGVTVKDLALGTFHTCALLTTGAVRCWGNSGNGQLGYGNGNTLGDNEPINNLANVSLTGTVRKIVAGEYHTCALTDVGTLRCWGRGIEGQLGQAIGMSNSYWGDQVNELPSMLASDIDIGSQVTDVTAGDYYTCALTSAGQLKCWGQNNRGQLGYGGTSNQVTPGAVSLDGVSAYRISAGALHTCALRSNGTVRCWGAGTDGRLGRGSTGDFGTATGGTANVQIFAP
jgi:alpha-tubulin suppressor-like RCC1 family protein